MQDNDEMLIRQGRHPMQAGSFEPLARAANAAANGRWGMAGMGAISLYVNQPRLAFVFVLVIIASHLAEALLSSRLLPIIYALLATLGAALVGVLGFVLWL